MDAYVYQASLLCPACARHVMARLLPHPDSDRYPQGPYADGGGESDTANVCDLCGIELDNPVILRRPCAACQAREAEYECPFCGWLCTECEDEDSHCPQCGEPSAYCLGGHTDDDPCVICGATVGDDGNFWHDAASSGGPCAVCGAP